MSAYLYTWNPSKWNWHDQQGAIYRVNNNEDYVRYWSCGNTKRIKAGDIFLLMRLGVEPKGIIGCGYILSRPYDLPHWDTEKADKGKKASRTDLLFMALSDSPIYSLIELKNEHPSVNWTPQSSGQSIPENIANAILEKIQHITHHKFQPLSKEKITSFSEGKSRIVNYKTYDRNPQAREACIAHYGYECSVCGFNFENAYGELGAKYIEVHHLNPVADIGKEYTINPIKDLRPVCANCHRMLHKTRPPLSIEQLRKHKNSLKSEP